MCNITLASGVWYNDMIHRKFDVDGQKFSGPRLLLGCGHRHCDHPQL